MSSTTVPILYPEGGLAGERVRLRTWRLDDADALAGAWSDDEVARWTAVPDETTPAAARRWITGDPTRLEAGRALDLVICTPADESVHGEVGLGPIDWSRRAAEVGYWVDSRCRGRGLATTALRMLTDWAVAELSLRLLVARCHPDNPASRAVAEQAGYGLERDDPEGRFLYVYRPSRELLA